MKKQFRSIAVMSTIAMSFSIASAQINLDANSINFRNYDNPAHITYHYGNLRLQGGASGDTWGWLQCNRIVNIGNMVNYGSLVCSGTIDVFQNLNVYGTKNFVHPHPTDSTKLIKYIAIESGEALTVARGTAKTENGKAEIELPDHFSLVTSEKAPLTVLLTPESAPVLLYTKNKSKTNVTVAMKKSDLFEFGDVQFAFQVTGVRDGFEDEEIIVDTDKMLKNEREEPKELNPVKQKIKGIAEKAMKMNKNEKNRK